MADTLKALKEFGKKCNTNAAIPAGNTIAEVINSITSNFNITGAKGDTGDTGASITGGVATLSNGSTVEITVTTTPAT